MLLSRQRQQELAEIRALTGELVTSTQTVLDRVRDARGVYAPPLLAFIHIPKTAGGTVLSMFAAAYSKGEIRDAGNYLRNATAAHNAAANPRKREGRVLAGHVPI